MADTLQSVSHALRLIQELQTREDGGVTELAESIGVANSTAHRLLATLQQHGFVERAGRRYRLGAAMQLSPDQASIQHCVEVAQPIMQALRDESQETVHLSVLQGTQSKFVAAIESPHIMRVTSRVGVTLPAHTTAAGKVLLAQLSDERLRELYPDHELPASTARTTTSLDRFMRELDAVRRAGHGRNYEESEVGLVALAVPIRRPLGDPVCSLTVTGPTARFNPSGRPEVSSREKALFGMLKRHARSIESRLSY